MVLKSKLILIFILCLLVQFAYSQTITIKGIVMDKYDKVRLRGVEIKVVDNLIKASDQKTTRTDENGHYSIEITHERILSASMIGYNTQEVLIEENQVVNIEMDCEDCGPYTGQTTFINHFFSTQATYRPSIWGSAIEYTMSPSYMYANNRIKKILSYTDLNVKMQNLDSSYENFRVFPHLTFSTHKIHFPLFSTHQKVYPYINAGYYFDTNFNKISQHNLGLGCGLKTRLISFKFNPNDFIIYYLNIQLTTGYTAYLDKKTDNTLYLGLRFYFGKIYVYE